MFNDAIITKVGEIATIKAGFPFRSSIDALESGNATIIQLRNIDPITGIDWSSTAEIALPSKRGPNYLESGDVLFVARGTKYYAFALRNIPERTVCSPHFFILKPEASCEAEFLAWYINQGPAQNHLRRRATGSHILNIRREALEDLTIAVPPKEKQRIIVQHYKAALREKLALKELIKNREQEIEALAQSLKRSIMEIAKND
jgi:restriction endonuclease S subunit